MLSNWLSWSWWWLWQSRHIATIIVLWFLPCRHKGLIVFTCLYTTWQGSLPLSTFSQSNGLVSRSHWKRHLPAANGKARRKCHYVCCEDGSSQQTWHFLLAFPFAAGTWQGKASTWIQWLNAHHNPSCIGEAIEQVRMNMHENQRPATSLK